MVDFFLIGASKSGTSALNHYLSDHPEIGMADVKEPHFFDADLSHNSGMDWPTYLKLFRSEKPNVRIWGETSPTYIRSRYAPKAIREHNPNARFLLLLRDPVEMAHSLHSQNLYGGNETETDFETAWRLQFQRERGRYIPAKCDKPESLIYGEYCRIGEQIEHWLQIFPRERFLFLLYEDLKHNPRQLYYRVLKFLGITGDNRQTFEVVNSNKTVRSRLFYQLLRMPPRRFPNLWADLRKSRFIRKTGRLLLQMNAREAQRAALRPEFERELREFFQSDIERIEGVTGYRLDHWKSRG